MGSDFSFETTRFAEARLTGDCVGPNAVPSHGFLPLRPAFQLPKVPPAILVNAKGGDAWYQSVHAMGRTVPELGLHFIDDAVVSGFLAVFKDGAFVEAPSEHDALIKQFTTDENLPAADLVGRKTTIDIDATGLVIGGPGYLVWGHWLIDYMPRLALAQIAWGRGDGGYVVPLPDDTPGWVFSFLAFFCGISRDRFVLYNRHTEALRFKRVCVPSFSHDGGLHQFMLETFQPLLRVRTGDGPRKICVSRRELGPTRSVSRSFREQLFFEEQAERAGYAIVRPERMSFRSQLDLFSGATHVVGEYGSGMHNAVFSPPGTIVGQFCMPNAYQSRIAELCGHVSAFLFPDHEGALASGEAEISVATTEIETFFRVINDI